MSLMNCPSCNVVLTSGEVSQEKCDACGSPVRRPSGSSFRDASVQFREPDDADVRPWTPSQIFGVSFAFGSGAGGVIAAINFSRMGQRAWVAPMVVASVLLFLVQAFVIVMVVPPEGLRMVGFLSNSALGLAYMLVQKPVFDGWKEQNFGAGAYKPNGLGLLFLVSLVCLAVELAVMVGLLIATGQA